MKYVLFALLAFALSGCAEMGLYNAREDCYGRYRERVTPPGYPCPCCRQGE